MGEAHTTTHVCEGRAGLTTALLVLVVLQENFPKPMTTYELGLRVEDDKVPPRPISVIVKTLATDGYIARVADAGKRAALWCITERGANSLIQRGALRTAAEAWLARNPNYSDDEAAVLNALLGAENLTPNQMAECCGRSLSPMRTAVKKLALRGLIDRTDVIFTGYELTVHGRAAAQKLAAPLTTVAA